MPNGNASLPCCRRSRRTARTTRIIDVSSMGCSSGSRPAAPGATCRSATDPGRPWPHASDAGRARASGIESSRRSGVISMRWENSTGISGASTAPTSERIGSPRARGKNPGTLRERGEPADHALGRSRGGFSTKIHLLTDGGGLPLGAELSAGQAHESRFVEPVLESVRVQRMHPGRPRSRPRRLAGDKGYSFPTVRALLRRRHIGAVIAERPAAATSAPCWSQADVRPRGVPAASFHRELRGLAQGSARPRHTLREARAALPRTRQTGHGSTPPQTHHHTPVTQSLARAPAELPIATWKGSAEASCP